MGLSGLQIFRLLPKTNCKECGYPTCMTFALQLGAEKTSLEACPDLAPDVRAVLADLAALPIRRVEIGPVGDRTIIGEETGLHRHEERFRNPPALAVMIDDSLNDDAADALLDGFPRLKFERVGESLRPRLVAVASGDAARLASRAAAAAERTGAGVVIVSDDPDALLAAGEHIKESRPLLCGARPDTFDRVAAVARLLDAPFALRGRTIEELATLGQRALEEGFQQVVMEPIVKTAGDALQSQVFLRRAAVSGGVKALGFPTISFPCRLSRDPRLKTLLASALVAKYAGVVVVDTVDPAHLLPLLALAQGLYSDPQRPMMVDAGVYPLGDPGPHSPVLITTNFSLTYYTVISEVEGSKVPAWLLVMDVDGQSVLTAWAAGKFVAGTIAAFVDKSGIESKVSRRRLIIPGYVASIRDELEAKLPGWEVAVGVREASDIPRYLQAVHAEV